ncbi:MAG TPA: hypothetical protein VHB53_00440 [Solirubrobacterales bacterium]|nr:hypothetical protein [Solirubrobacterales bacterium]
MRGVQVSVEHIEAMLAAADRYGGFSYPGGGTFSFYHRGERLCLCSADDYAAVGRVLWTTNLASVEAGLAADRGTRAGATHLRLVPDLKRDFRFEVNRRRTPSPVETLKLCACYRYQSSDAKAWASSEAAAFVDALEHCAIAALPGYDDAPWDWSRCAPSRPGSRPRSA